MEKNMSVAKVMGLSLALLVSTNVFAEPTDNVMTRFGKLGLTSERPTAVTLNGKATDLAGVGFEKVFALGNADVVLVQDDGNCAGYHFLTLKSKTDLKESKSFGTCSDLPKVVQNGDVIKVTLPNAKTGKGQVTFIYKDGKVAAEGKSNAKYVF